MLLPIIKNLKITSKTAETEQQQEQPEILAPSLSPPPKQNEQKPVVSAPQPPPPSEQKTPVTPAGQAKENAAPEQKPPEKKPQTEKPAPPAQPSTPPASVSTPPVKPVETRDRSIYLIQESNMVQVKVNRKINVSNTPLLDSINALLAGPTADERRRGMESFVPEGSRLLKPPIIIGSTVHLDFNQEFRYNPRGSEGCAAQIKQIVWTATEFPNVKDVQFFIEGQRVDFLSEGVVIRNPIGR